MRSTPCKTLAGIVGIHSGIVGIAISSLFAQPAPHPHPATEDQTMRNLKEFIHAYMTTALWSAMDTNQPDNERSLQDQGFDIRDIALSTRRQMEAECRDFYEANADLIDTDLGPDMAGHDFWLTRNGHGAGYWDGDWQDGDTLTENAEAFERTGLAVASPVQKSACEC